MTTPKSAAERETRLREVLEQIAEDCEQCARQEGMPIGDNRAWKAVARIARKALEMTTPAKPDAAPAGEIWEALPQRFVPTVSALLDELAAANQRIAYLEAQEALLQEWQDKYEAEKARADEVVRPLDEQMRRLNENLLAERTAREAAGRKMITSDQYRQELAGVWALKEAAERALAIANAHNAEAIEADRAMTRAMVLSEVEARNRDAEQFNALHIAICQAVTHMNMGDTVPAHALLRQALVDYADAIDRAST